MLKCLKSLDNGPKSIELIKLSSRFKLNSWPDNAEMTVEPYIITWQNLEA